MLVMALVLVLVLVLIHNGAGADHAQPIAFKPLALKHSPLRDGREHRSPL